MARERVSKRREGNEIEFSRHLADSEVTDALWDQRENLLAFAISFAVIGRFWVVLLPWPSTPIAPALAPYMWLVLFLDPSARLAARWGRAGRSG